MIGVLGVGGTGSASPAAAVSGDIVVGPAGCGDVGYVTDGVADNVQIQAAVEAAGDGDKGIRANRFIGASRRSAIYLANDEAGGPDSADGSLKLAARRLAAKNALGVRAIEIGN